MPLLLILLAIGVFVYAWWSRRGKTLTRDCRWRLDRPAGPDIYRCAACGAVCEGPPKDCLRPRERL